MDNMEVKRDEMIDKLNKAGLKVNKGEKKIKNGRYSGIIGNERKILKLNI